MKGSGRKEEADPKKKYIFFSDPDIIVKRAEDSAAAVQARQFFQIHQQQGQCTSRQDVPEDAFANHPPSCSAFKGVDNILTYHPVQPYPFTFITAVKRKLALGTCPETCKKAYEPNQQGRADIDLDVTNVNAVSKQSLYQTAQKMDFIKPLKVPDLKISPKTLDYSPREGSSTKEVTQQKNHVILKKFETTSKEVPPQKSDRPSRSTERVQRRLDFTLSEESPIKSCENIEPLKAPDFFIASSLTKKKEHARDSSREKENRSKRIKKDDSSFSKEDEFLQDTSKKSRNSRHLSRKDIAESIFKTSKNENILTLSRDSDFTLKKPKSKNFVTSTARKDDDRRHRSSSIQSAKSTRDKSLETRSRTFSNESASDRAAKLQERITVKDGFRGKMTETLEYKNDYQLPNVSRQAEDQKYKYLDSRSLKQQSRSSNQSQTRQLDGSSKESKRISDKQKCFTSKMEEKHCTSVSEISEDIETASDSNVSLRNRSGLSKIGNFGKNECFLYSEASSQQSKSKNLDKCIRDVQSTLQPGKPVRNSEDLNYIESSSGRSSIANARKNEESLTQAVMVTDSAQTNTNGESKNSNEGSFSEVMLDPRRISFRDDSFTPQEEFCDLITPDTHINLTLRSKRKKKAAQGNDSDMDIRSPKYKPTAATQGEDKGIQLLHPTALHMQFQAELHLLDSFNESLRQVMDVEKCLYDVKHEQEQELLQKQKQVNEEMQKQLIVLQSDRDTIDKERHSGRNRADVETIDKEAQSSNDDATEGVNAVDAIRVTRGNSELQGTDSHGLADCGKQLQCSTDKFNDDLRKQSKSVVKVAEVQTQTVNDIATQTDVRLSRHNVPDKFREISGITYQRGSLATYEIPRLSIESLDRFEDLDQIEDVSLPSRMRTMSEISLHETTSSIKTETGTEISISTRDVTCSFNKYLDLEMAQLIKDEKQRYDKIEMLFKSREKSLNDRTKKLVKLEEQKRALRDTGQDSRISSVKKKQRALLLKLQQEKDEMNRLKELHKMASQERKLMLQKQRNMFNPQMSTKNILTKLKKSADSQSPRRLSGPMKGYDIRSPSSMSSLVDSDKSQLDRFQLEIKSQTSDARSHKLDEKIARSNLDISTNERLDFMKTDTFNNLAGESNNSLMKSDKSEDLVQIDAKQQKLYSRTQKGDAKSKYDVKSRKYEEKMPGADVLRLKSHHLDVESKLTHGKPMNLAAMQCNLQKSKSSDASKAMAQDLDKSISEYVKSESDTLVEELSRKSKSSQATESHAQNSKSVRERESTSKDATIDAEALKVESDSVVEESRSKRSKSSQIADDVLQANLKIGKKSDKLEIIDKEGMKKLQHSPESKSSSKRKGSRGQKTKSSSDVLTENILRSKSSSQISEEIIKHHSKRSKVEESEDVQSEDNDQNSILEELDFNESQSSLQALVKRSRAVKKKNYELLRDIASEHDAKENVTAKNFTERGSDNRESGSRREEGDLQNLGNISTRSQVSTLTISRHSSGDSEKSYSRSVVIRAQDHHFKTSKKLEQILSAREAALTSRRNCVEEWIAWHARLRAEENRIARMEQAAFKLVSATSNALSYHDTTVSSDTSDMEGRIELLTEKLTERRAEMTGLKKEARRQAKQRLRALETNLLNQIKKYDTTIHEMRKKLELKKAAARESESEKLAIESRSLVDYKIPEISIKRIQEICKSSDLLRSRSESDLIFEKGRHKARKDVYTMDYEDKGEESSSQRSVRSVGSKSTEKSDDDRRNTGHNDRSIFDEVKSLTSGVPQASSVANDDKSISEQIESDECGFTRRSISAQSQTSKHDFYSETRSDSDDVPIKSVALAEVSRTKRALEHVPSVRSDKLSQGSVTSENIPSELSTVRSRTEDTISEAKPLTNDFENIPESVSKSSRPRVALKSGKSIEDNCDTLEECQSRSKSQTNLDLSGKSSSKGPSRQESLETVNEEIVPESEYSKSNSGRSLSVRPVDSSVVEEIKTVGSLEDSPTFSRKLNILELDNKNLNDDISMLENDLRALSDMVSRFSKRSDDRLKSDIVSRTNEDKTPVTVDEKSTSKDVSEELPKSDTIGESDKSENVIDDATMDRQILFASDPTSERTSLPTTDNEVVHDSNVYDKNSRNKISEIMSKIMPEDVSPCRSTQKIDFKARSKEILNEIERSIISEHVKSSENLKESMLHLQKENESALNDLNSLQGDIRSIARIISKMAENKSDLGTGTDIVAETACIQGKPRNVRTDMSDMSEEKLHKSSTGGSVDSITFSQISEAKDLGELAKDESENLAMTFDDSPIKTYEVDEAYKLSERSTDVLFNEDPASFHARSHAIRNEEYFDVSDSVAGERVDDPSSKRIEVVRDSSRRIEVEKHEVPNENEQRLGKSEDVVETVEKLDDCISSEITHHEEGSLPIVDEEHQSSVSERDRKNILDVSNAREPSSEFEHDDDGVKRIVSSENASEKYGYHERHDETIGRSFLDRDWTTSDSFEIQQNLQERSADLASRFDVSAEYESREASKRSLDTREIDENDRTLASNIDDMSVFVPNYESTKIEVSNARFDDSILDENVTKTDGMTVDEIDDILDVIARESERSKGVDDITTAIPDVINKISSKIKSEVETNSLEDRGIEGIEANELALGEDQTWRARATENLEIKKNARDDFNRVEDMPEDSSETLHKIVESVASEERENERVSRVSLENVGGSRKNADDNVESDSLEEPSVSIETVEEDERLPMISISLSVEIEEGEVTHRKSLRPQDITITELLPEDEESKTLSEFVEIDAKIELADDDLEESHVQANAIEDEKDTRSTRRLKNAQRENDPETVEDIQEMSEHDGDQESSDGEQLDNFVEVAESRLDTVEKIIEEKRSQSIRNVSSGHAHEIDVRVDVHSKFDADLESADAASHAGLGKEVEIEVASERKNLVFAEAIDKTFEILKDPEYEDISEESLEVSEILDRSESQKSGRTIPGKYETVQKPEDALRILDEISQRSRANVDVGVLADRGVSSESSKVIRVSRESKDDSSVDLPQESERLSRKPDGVSDKSEDVSRKHDVDASSSESSEGVDTPRGVPEIEMDSPRDPNDSRLDVDALDDDLLGSATDNQNDEAKSEFNVTPIVTTSEKDIEAMIDKLKASLEQPGLEVAELKAKLLRIEQLQIDLEIKRLEAEEVSYYVREIPNKPPPPYTPPGGGRLPSSQASPSPPPPAVVPTNIEELTVFTEKATKLIFEAKQSGEDIANLEPPLEICELSKDSSEIARRDRRIYNTFLFDLCKEITVEVYQLEYEKPGPSWSKPNVKTKPTVKIPKTMEELNEYVGKEVATLFGFKTKLQRENMVMRWSRKRRDRVDELLAREAQAEEDEWTKFHHDELAVKNELTAAILDSLIAETASIVKAVYAKKKRKVMA